MLFSGQEFWHDKSGGQNCDDANWHVYIEYPAPTPVIGDPASKGRSNDRGETKDSDDQALPFSAFSRWKEITDDGHSDWHHSTGSQTLNATVYNQFGHVLTGTC